MRLRTEQWVLLGILAAGVTLVGLQLGQEWAVPDLERGPAAGGRSQRSAAPSARPGAPPGGGGAAAPEAGGTAPAASAAADPPAAGAPAGEESPAGARGLLALRAEPASPAAGEPFGLFVTLAEVTGASAVSFDLSYDPAALTYDEGAFSAVTALHSTGGPPDIEIVAARPGLLSVKVVRRAASEPPTNDPGDLLVVQFTPVRRGPAPLRISRARMTDSQGSDIPARAAEITIEVR